MTTPGALQISKKQASARFGNDIIMGTGTVLDAESARAAILAGARFIVAPNLNPDVIEICNRYSIVSMPGALTPTEIMQAWDLGADVVKIFPANQFGPGYIKAVKAPLPQVRIAPVGGVSADNIADFMRAGASCAGIGSTWSTASASPTRIGPPSPPAPRRWWRVCRPVGRRRNGARHTHWVTGTLKSMDTAPLGAEPENTEATGGG